MEEILSLDLPAQNIAEALLRYEFLEEHQLLSLACDFAEHTLKVFEVRAPGDERPKQCIEVARQYISGSAGVNELEMALDGAEAACMRFFGTGYTGAFAALVALPLLTGDAAHAAREIANASQIAAHRLVYEAHEEKQEPIGKITARTEEAEWQLERIKERLGIAGSDSAAHQEAPGIQ